MPPVEPGRSARTRSRPSSTWRSRCSENRPRALIQMATGTRQDASRPSPSIYRLIKFGGARRVLFLVDRANLGEQAEKEFQQLPHARRQPEVHRAVQRPAADLEHDRRRRPRSCITTIQRLYSMLKGEPELDPEARGGARRSRRAGAASRSRCRSSTTRPSRPSSSTSSSSTSATAPSTTLWRQVLEYFDAYLIGLTATPAKQTFGFFNQNLVMEYRHEQAVADGVNVRLRGLPHPHADHRAGLHHRGRARHDGRLPRPADAQDALGGARRGPHLRRRRDLDRDVVAKDQIRLIVRTFRDKLFTEIFPGRTRGAQDADLRQGRHPRRGHRRDRPRGVRQGQRLLPEDHLQDHRREARRPHPGLPQQLQPAHRRHRGHDRHRHRHQAARDRACSCARCKSRVLLRADEGPRRARHQPGRPPGRHARRHGQDPLRHRRLRRRDRDDAVRHQAAGEEAQRVAQGAARARRRGGRERRRTCRRSPAASRASTSSAVPTTRRSSPRRPAASSLASISSALVDALDPDQQDDAARADVRPDRRPDTPTEEQIEKAASAAEEGGRQPLMAKPAAAEAPPRPQAASSSRSSTRCSKDALL